MPFVVQFEIFIKQEANFWNSQKNNVYDVISKKE